MMELHDVIDIWLKEEDLDYEVAYRMDDCWVIQHKGSYCGANFNSICHIYDNKAFVVTWGEPAEYITSYQLDFFTRLKAHIVKCEQIHQKWYPTTAASVSRPLLRGVQILFGPIFRFLGLSH